MTKATLQKYFFYASLSVLLGTIVFYFPKDNLSATVIIFGASLAFFHAILFRYKKHENIWKSTDYLFEIVAILSIIAAVSGLNEAAKQRALQEQFTKRKLAQVELIYAAQTVVTNDCNPLESRNEVWEISPEPNEGECDRITHMLPQMQFDFDLETGPENMSSDNLWGFNFEYKNQKLEGTWTFVQEKAVNLIKVSLENEYAVAQREEAKSRTGFDIAKIESVFYWHHVLAFLLALKISRISMDIFKKNTETAP